jgi:hypothetical protein
MTDDIICCSVLLRLHINGAVLLPWCWGPWCYAYSGGCEAVVWESPIQQTCRNFSFPGPQPLCNVVCPYGWAWPCEWQLLWIFSPLLFLPLSPSAFFPVRGLCPLGQQHTMVTTDLFVPRCKQPLHTSCASNYSPTSWLLQTYLWGNHCWNIKHGKKYGDMHRSGHFVCKVRALLQWMLLS